MARTLPECDEMIRACQEAGVTLMVAFMKRFDKSMRHAKALIDQGRLGKPYHLLCDWRGGYGGPDRTALEPVVQPDAVCWRGKLETWGASTRTTAATPAT